MVSLFEKLFKIQPVSMVSEKHHDRPVQVALLEHLFEQAPVAEIQRPGQLEIVVSRIDQIMHGKGGNVAQHHQVPPGQVQVHLNDRLVAQTVSRNNKHIADVGMKHKGRFTWWNFSRH